MFPRYAHDCKDCTFAGTLGIYDIYKCPQNGYPTIVARYGNAGPSYDSGDSIKLNGIRLTLEPDVHSN